MGTRNDFLESIRFDISPAIEEYARYLYDYKYEFQKQALKAHVAIMHAFPELDFHTICRIKSFDSALNKIRHKGLDKVYDIHGMKHIINSVDGKQKESILIDCCYEIKNFLEKYYSKNGTTIMHDRTKDYICEPKENGYAAIHISGTANDNSCRKFEEQIKTARMEEIAKYGNASHAEKYKPRELGRNPLVKVPRYTVIRNENGTPVMHELSLEDCFQYFYNVPYEDYLEEQRCQ